MRAGFRIVSAIIVILIISVAVFINMASPCDRTKTTYLNFKVNETDGLDDVADNLVSEGLVKNAASFAAVAGFTHLKSFRPGTYYLSPSMSSVDIARTMVRGITTSSGFTIPAGYNLEQTASVLERDGIADKDAFMKAAASEDLKQIDIIGENNLGSEQVEGFLFPGDYSIDNNADESMLIITMLNQFSNFFNDDYRARVEELGMSVREILYIASMIEQETRLDYEKKEISSVIHNRYNLEMMPPSDIRKVPLCSPGAESIAAALYPAENDNIYYVYSSKLDGSHVFTNDENEYHELLQQYNEAMSGADQS